MHTLKSGFLGGFQTDIEKKGVPLGLQAFWDPLLVSAFCIRLWHRCLFLNYKFMIAIKYNKKYSNDSMREIQEPYYGLNAPSDGFFLKD